MYRIGQGFDIHRLTPGRPLLLGGVHIESDVGADAHSDGDVLLHALIDALLGAACLGDIGEHFPPSDPQYQNANSLDLLKKTLALITPQFKLMNVDSTLFLERPKLSSYKPRIQETVANALGLDDSQVSIKAKTFEGLGPIGLGEAVAASVIVQLVQKTP